MKTIKEFDYDLFKVERDHYIRIKRTGEVEKVSEEVFKLLRNEHMKAYRGLDGLPIYRLSEGKYRLQNKKKELSIDALGIEKSFNLTGEMEDSIINDIELEKFYYTLTEKQKDVLKNCLLNEISVREFAKIKGVHKSTVDEVVRGIRDKYRKYLK